MARREWKDAPHTCLIAEKDFAGTLPDSWIRAGFRVTQWPVHAWLERAVVFARRAGQNVFIVESMLNPESDTMIPRVIVRPDGHITKVDKPRLASQETVEYYLELAEGSDIEKLYWLVAWKSNGLISNLPPECEVLREQ